MALEFEREITLGFQAEYLLADRDYDVVCIFAQKPPTAFIKEHQMFKLLRPYGFFPLGAFLPRWLVRRATVPVFRFCPARRYTVHFLPEYALAILSASCVASYPRTSILALHCVVQHFPASVIPLLSTAGAIFDGCYKRNNLQSTRKDRGVRFRNIRYGGQYLSKRKKPINNTNIPQRQIEAIARCILPDILAFYESIEGQREFEEWKKQRKAEQET